MYSHEHLLSDDKMYLCVLYLKGFDSVRQQLSHFLLYDQEIKKFQGKNKLLSTCELQLLSISSRVFENIWEA